MTGLRERTPLALHFQEEYIHGGTLMVKASQGSCTDSQ